MDAGVAAVTLTSTPSNRDRNLSYFPVMAGQHDVRSREMAQVVISIWLTDQLLGAGRPAVDAGVALVVEAEPHPRYLGGERECVCESVCESVCVS